jgi:anthranilate phosphoribosyltransferase
MKTYIQKLIEGHGLTRDEAYDAICTIMKGGATDAQIAAFLTALRLCGETPEIVSGAARAMREAFTPVTSPHPDAVDTCGTGGDGLNTFNISFCHRRSRRVGRQTRQPQRVQPMRQRGCAH